MGSRPLPAPDKQKRLSPAGSAPDWKGVFYFLEKSAGRRLFLCAARQTKDYLICLLRFAAVLEKYFIFVAFFVPTCFFRAFSNWLLVTVVVK